jgi:putative methyltransferase (TIGR04325 family)
VIRRLLRRPTPTEPDFFVDTGEPSDDVWAQPFWLELSKAKLVGLDGRVTGYALTVALVINELVAERGACRVLDFGGGTGFIYFTIEPALRRVEAVEWHVVDAPSITAIGVDHARTISADRIAFHREPPRGPFDLLYVNTVLQYPEEPLELLDRLLTDRPRVVVLTRLLAGELPTTRVRQRLGDGELRVWLLDVRAVESLLEHSGYDVLLSTPTDPVGVFDEGVPPEHRLASERTIVARHAG